MADERTHMAADLATAMEDPNGQAVDIILDGIIHRAFVQDLPFQDCPYDGIVLARKGITMQLGAIPAPIPTQQMMLDSVSYTVESSLQVYPAMEIILTRFAS